MGWVLEDQLTHECMAFTPGKKWIIGRKDDPSGTKMDNILSEHKPALNRKADILIPITQDYEKTRGLFDKYELVQRVSRFHGIFGVDGMGAYFIDFSSNGTFTKSQAGKVTPCQKGKTASLQDGISIYLSGSYPLKLYKRGWLSRLSGFLKERKWI